MSSNWTADIRDMHTKFGVRETIQNNIADPEWLKLFLQFRLDFLTEELNETFKASMERDPEEIVDGLIDLCVVAIGTMDAFGVDANKAWDEVLKANMIKSVGMKASRPNALGMPDLCKPEGWQPPCHEDNHGQLVFCFND